MSRKRPKRGREESITLHHGTAGATLEAVRAEGMKAAGSEEGLLMFEEPELARPHAVAAAALLAHNGREDPTGLIVTARVRRAVAKPEPSVPGAYWVRGRVKPKWITALSVFDASEELADPEFVADMASRFDFEGCHE